MPVLVVRDIDRAQRLADTLTSSGLTCAEITFRTDAAEEALRIFSSDERLITGAGTVTSVDLAARAIAAGAKFIVSPGFDRDVVDYCQSSGTPVFPGVATATEVQMARGVGLDVLKFFPAEAAGGLNYMSSLAGAFRSVRFIPTGGINAGNLEQYLSSPVVLAVGGTWLVSERLQDADDWDVMRRRCREAVEMASLFRGTSLDTMPRAGNQ